ncbi:DUF317 domain-containing protein [Streptomyces sp. NPDC088789]|uniref:DUF317 domain-containing protein n=1 Tax=Streptomyces sp. NPDC088789 TaxID=3365899 RepID=UPI00381A8DA8
MNRPPHPDWSGWHDLPQQHYLIEPRCLAGGGDLRHITEHLRASGWKDRSRAAGPVVFDHPDRGLRVGFDPAPPGRWTITGQASGHQPPWEAKFTARTPVEIIAGLTDALTQPPSAHAPNVWAPLDAQGWTTRSGQHVTATSPDRNAFVQFHQPSPGQAHWWIGARNEHGRAWDAELSPTTPLYLVQALTTALADPRPVMRPRGMFAPSDRIRTTSVSLRPSELGAWQQARINSARAATWARNAWATARPRSPRPSTAARVPAGHATGRR